jgi:hypothetical protein
MAVYMQTADLIDERERTHGDFTVTARIAQAIKEVYRSAPNWSILTPRQREAMEMAATKDARILSGDPNDPDHWRDRNGYMWLGGE